MLTFYFTEHKGGNIRTGKFESDVNSNWSFLEDQLNIFLYNGTDNAWH